MTQRIQLQTIIPEHCAGQRLDQVLAKLYPEHSRARLQEWIKAQSITVNGTFKRPKDKVAGGELVIIDAEIVEQDNWQAQDIALDIQHEDDDILVVNKPIDLVVHPAAGNPEGTMLNALLHHCPQLSTIPRAGIVHRLDKDTSGLLVVAKSLIAHTSLIKQLQARSMHREYSAVCQGLLTSGGTINEPIGRHPKNRVKMAVTHGGKAAVTHYRIAQTFSQHTHIKVRLETGRTHQIRVHMAHIHHPLVGDQTYGGRLKIPANASPELTTYLREFQHQALHALKLGLVHPRSGKNLQWTVPEPPSMAKLLRLLEEDCLS